MKNHKQHSILLCLGLALFCNTVSITCGEEPSYAMVPPSKAKVGTLYDTQITAETKRKSQPPAGAQNTKDSEEMVESLQLSGQVEVLAVDAQNQPTKLKIQTSKFLYKIDDDPSEMDGKILHVDLHPEVSVKLDGQPRMMGGLEMLLKLSMPRVRTEKEIKAMGLDTPRKRNDEWLVKTSDVNFAEMLSLPPGVAVTLDPEGSKVKFVGPKTHQKEECVTTQTQLKAKIAHDATAPSAPAGGPSFSGTISSQTDSVIPKSGILPILAHRHKFSADLTIDFNGLKGSTRLEFSSEVTNTFVATEKPQSPKPSSK